jgi:hypothetical protein
MAFSKGHTLKASDVLLPDPVYEYGNGINTITSTFTGYDPLPTTPVTAALLNPHPTKRMLSLVGWGGWGLASTNGFRVSTAIRRAGAIWMSPGIGMGGPIGWGELIAVGIGTNVGSYFVMNTVFLDVSPLPYVFELKAYRDGAAGTQTWEYPTLRITPIGFVV